MSALRDFKTFILRGNVVDLAVGIVIGAAFGTVVSALVKDLITPLIAAIGGRCSRRPPRKGFRAHPGRGLARRSKRPAITPTGRKRPLTAGHQD